MGSANPIDAAQAMFKSFEQKFDTLKKSQTPPVMCLLEGVQGSVQGTLIGAVSHFLNKNMNSMNAQNPNMTPDMKAQMEKMQALQPKTIWGSVRNFMVLFGVQASLTAAFKHYRKDKDDIWNTVGPALGAGAAFALASGQPEQAPAMAMGFAVFSGIFYKVGEWTGSNDNKGGSAPKDDRFLQSHFMLNSMNLGKYHKNVRNGQLSDDTIMLWNDAALQEARIPPGPRLLILHHIEQVRSQSKPGAQRILAPAYPIEVPDSYQSGGQQSK